MLLPAIHATMTQKEIQAEKEETSTIILPSHFVPNEDAASSSACTGSNESTITGTTSSSTTATDTQQSSLNFEYGKAAEWIKRLINNSQLLERREEIRMEQTEGELLAQKLQDAKQITSGILFKTG